MIEPEPVYKPFSKSRLSLSVLIVAILASGVMLGCGRKDDPLPPLRYTPAPARDLTLQQQGGILILDMGYPQSTTSGLALPGLEAVEVFWLLLPEGASAKEFPERTFAAQAELLFRLSGAELTSSTVGDRIATRFPVPSEIGVDRQSVWAVRSIGSTGEVSPFSNLASLAFAARLRPPSDLQVVAEPEGIRVDWQLPEGAVGTNLYRRLATERQFTQPLATLDGEAISYLDTSARFGERYIYGLRAVASSEPLVESDASAEREINFLDTFAPAAPAGLLALGEQSAARLVIEASPSPDASGYVLYRQDPRAEFRRITERPIAALEYLDSGLTPGLQYVYYATAVDAAGNEGEPSPLAQVTIPQQ